MNIQAVLGNLYSGNSKLALKVINHSVYISDYKNREDSFVIHTGFIFNIHTGVQLEILYDLFYKIIIRQPRNEGRELLDILGLSCVWEKGYFKGQIPLLVKGLSINRASFNLVEVSVDDLKGEKFSSTNEFVLFKSVSEERCRFVEAFPLQKTLEDEIFFYNNTFYLDSPKPYSDYDSDYDSDYNGYDAISDGEREVESWNEDFPGWSAGFD